MTLILQGTDNSVSSPAVQGGTGGTGTGVYYPSGNTVALATNGTVVLQATSAQKVLIGSAAGTPLLLTLGGGASGTSTGIALNANSGTGTYAYWSTDGTSQYLASSVGSTGIKLTMSLSAPDSAMTIDSSGNILFKTTSVSNISSDTALQLGSNSSGAGAANSNTFTTFTRSITATVTTTILTVADIDKWAGTILISYVRDLDQNRSGMKMVRYAYNRTFTSLLDSSQNSGCTFSVSGNAIQVNIGGNGNMYCQISIWGGAGA